jgi:hypothetical protein
MGSERGRPLSSVAERSPDVTEVNGVVAGDFVKLFAEAALARDAVHKGEISVGLVS